MILTTHKTHFFFSQKNTYILIPNTQLYCSLISQKKKNYIVHFRIYAIRNIDDGRRSSIGVVIKDFRGGAVAAVCRVLLGNLSVEETEAFSSGSKDPACKGNGNSPNYC